MPIGKSLHEADLLDEARAIIEGAARAAPSIPLPAGRGRRTEFAATHRRPSKAWRGRRRRDDPRHRPLTAALYASVDRTGRHHRLERPGRRVRVRPVRRRHQGHRQAIAAVGVLHRRRRRHPGGHREVRHHRQALGYISTGGGAFLEFLEGKTLPAVAILERARPADRPCAGHAGPPRGPVDHRARCRPASPPRTTSPPLRPSSPPTYVSRITFPCSAPPRSSPRSVRPARTRSAEDVLAGVNVVRMNFSHGTAAEHMSACAAVRETRDSAAARSASCATCRARRSASASSSQARSSSRPVTLHPRRRMRAGRPGTRRASTTRSCPTT
jgi:hypothetical protein